MKKSYAIKVPIKDAQEIKLIINKNKLRNNECKLKKDKEFIYYPIKNFESKNNILTNRSLKINNFKIIIDEFEEIRKKNKNLQRKFRFT